MAIIFIVGLGPGPVEQLTADARRILLSSKRLHLVGTDGSSLNIENGAHSCSYELDVDPIVLAKDVVADVEKWPEVTLAVPGDPTDWQILLEALDRFASVRGTIVRRVSGVSTVSSVLNILDLSGLPGIHVTMAEHVAAKTHPPFGTDCPVLVMGLRSRNTVTSLKMVLLNQYQPEFRVAIVHWNGQKGETCDWLALEGIDKVSSISQVSTLYLPAADEMSGFAGLQDIVAKLRGPEGCPWDQEQTHLSLRSNLLEEVYETLGAIESGDSVNLVEELGDLLLQVVLQIQIAVDAKEFQMGSVIAGINKKLVRRHPHVFAGESVDGVEDVLRNWQSIKRVERNSKKDSADSELSGIPPALPALAQAQIYQTRAAQVGFDWPQLSGVIKKFHEEIEELRKARGSERKMAETGDLLFSLVNLARRMDIDAESALREANTRFRSRFEDMELYVRRRGDSIAECSIDDLNVIWDMIKEKRRSH